MIARLCKAHPAAAFLIALAAPSWAGPPDEAAIREVETRQEQAWNTHDARAYARLFAEDADVINVLGWHWKGRAEAEQKLGSAFAFVFARSSLHIDDVAIRPLSDDLALAHVTWTMTGARSPDGSGGSVPQHGIQTQLLRKTDGRWLILSFQNTNAVPERPFPMGPAAVSASPPNPPGPPEGNKNGGSGCWVANRDGKCLIYKRKAR